MRNSGIMLTRSSERIFNPMRSRNFIEEMRYKNRTIENNLEFLGIIFFKLFSFECSEMYAKKKCTKIGAVTFFFIKNVGVRVNSTFLQLFLENDLLTPNCNSIYTKASLEESCIFRRPKRLFWTPVAPKRAMM